MSFSTQPLGASVASAAGCCSKRSKGTEGQHILPSLQLSCSWGHWPLLGAQCHYGCYAAVVSSRCSHSARALALHDALLGMACPRPGSCMCRVCVAAFAEAMLAGETQPGVWFPEEREALQNRMALLKASADGCVRFELNRPPWALESNPTRLGFGIYID